MRIGIDARLWQQTGVGRYIRNLAINVLRLDKKNTYVIFILPKDEDLISSELTKFSNVKLVNADVSWHTISEQLKFPGIIKKQKLDLMHFTYFSVPILYSGKFVITIHDLIIHHYSTGKASTKSLPVYHLKRFFYKKIVQVSAGKAKKIIAVSKATKHEIIDHLNVSPDKVEVIYEGVTELGTGISSKINFPYILYVGNLYPHKNVERVLVAFSKSTKPSGAKFVIVGKRDFFRKNTEDKVRELGIEKEVIFTNEISDNLLNSYYSQASATIVPSLMEGFGLPALEAMKNNCLVICSDIPSLVEVCEGAAIYFDPNDTSSIKEAIEKSFEAKYKNKIEEGKKRVALFSWKNMAKQTLDIYESSTGLRQG